MGRSDLGGLEPEVRSWKSRREDSGSRPHRRLAFPGARLLDGGALPSTDGGLPPYVWFWEVRVLPRDFFF